MKFRFVFIAGAAADAELRCRHTDYFVYGKNEVSSSFEHR
jgi:hypothetical protein